MKESTLTSEERRDAIIAAAEDKKANYITALDLRGKTLIADFFIICSGTSNIHIRSVADGIMEAMETRGIRQRRIEGYSEATWVLLDYGDAIVHVMSEEQRSFYGLEKLWTGQAPPAREPERLEGMGVGEFEEDETGDDGSDLELDEDEDSENEELEDAAVDEPVGRPTAGRPTEERHGRAA
jgi:ribosome-associated protein